MPTTPSGLSVSAAEELSRQQQQQLATNKSQLKEGQLFYLDIGEGGKQLAQYKNGQLNTLGFNFPTDWGGKTIGQWQNETTQKAIQQLGINPNQITDLSNDANYLWRDVVKGLQQNKVTDINQFGRGLGTVTTGGQLGVMPDVTQAQRTQMAQNLANQPIGGATQASVNASNQAVWGTPTVQAAMVGGQQGSTGITTGQSSTPPAGAVYISNPAELAGLKESDIWRDPNSKKIYKLQKATLTSPDGSKKTVVAVGSPQASQLLSSGWTLGTSNTASFIDSSLLNSQEPININGINNYSDTSLSDITNAAVAKYTEQQRKVIAEIEANQRPKDEQDLQYQKLLDSLTSTYENAKSLETIKAEEQAKADITAQKQALSQKLDEIDIALAKISALDSSYQAANAEVELKPQALFRQRGQQATNYKMYLAQRNTLSADVALLTAEAKRMEGNVNDAIALANDAINLRYQSQQDNINNQINMLNILIPQIDKKDKEYATALATIKQQELDVLNEKKSWMTTAVSNGIFDATILKQVENSGSYAEAMGIIGKNMPQGLGEFGELLSPTEAASLGVPYGTTKGQAMQLGVIPKSQLTGQDKINLEVKLANDFEKYAKESRNAQRQIGIMETGYNAAVQAGLDGTSNNAPSQAVLVTFQKLLDPTSVVRESEYARSGDGQSILQRMQGTIEKLQRGGAGVTQAELQNFYELSQQLLNGYQNEQLNFAQRIQTQANNYGLNIENILTPDVIGLLGSNNNYIQPLMQSYNSLSTLVKENPNYYSIVEQMINNEPNLSDEDIMQILTEQSLGFNQVGGDTKTAVATLAKPEGSTGGQCGRFVNQITGLGLGDSYQSKLAKMDRTIKTPQPGMVFVMPLSGNYSKYGHTGIILDIENGIATVKDSNWGKDEKIRIHQIPVSKMTGFARTNINNLV